METNQKSNLYIKMHPNYLAWLIDESNYQVVPITNDLKENSEILFNTFNNMKWKSDIKKIVVEKPFLKLMGENSKKLASDIIHIQRNFGAILFIFYYLFNADVIHQSSKIVRESIFKNNITKDMQITEASALLKNIQDKKYNPVQILCLHDVLTLKSFMENYNG